MPSSAVKLGAAPDGPRRRTWESWDAEGNLDLFSDDIYVVMRPRRPLWGINPVDERDRVELTMAPHDLMEVARRLRDEAKGGPSPTGRGIG